MCIFHCLIAVSAFPRWLLDDRQADLQAGRGPRGRCAHAEARAIQRFPRNHARDNARQAAYLDDDLRAMTAIGLSRY
jgi:hypothetical protein